MTPAQLAAIRAAIEQDAATEASLDDAPWSAGDGNMVYDCDNRPLILWGGEDPRALARARNRWPLYLALARACYAMFDDDTAHPTLPATRSVYGVLEALANLAPTKQE